ncbi:hypothetical protein B0H66DRAFT_165282 [Apodospora peruviana]|uniref:HNH nuclease domain-containing protein n=1 Tax=Apodospora peruviana TaxID=516989 RepID=A0AAE0IKH4_9PEZI|nr:hypothetical protein B0H66DRAFT_165282 [Apodospora peruviana]
MSSAPAISGASRKRGAEEVDVQHRLYKHSNARIYRHENELRANGSLGCPILETGRLPSPSEEQSQLRNDLIEAYKAASKTHDDENPSSIVAIYDTATGHYYREDNTTRSIITAAAHLVPYTLNPKYFDDLIDRFSMNAEESGLKTFRNGLLLHTKVKQVLDDGAIAIVPDLPEDDDQNLFPTPKDMGEWEKIEPKVYRWKVIDRDTQTLDESIYLESDDDPTTQTQTQITIRELDKRPLFFKSDQRPYVGFVYFLFQLAQVKLWWWRYYRAGDHPTITLRLSWLGMGFWGDHDD